MDEMDYVMQEHDSAANPQAQQQMQYQPACPYWRDQSARNSLNRGSVPQYDPVNNSWIPQPTHSWSTHLPHSSLHNSRPPSEPYYPYLIHSGHSGPRSLAASSGPVQPSLTHGQSHPHHDLSPAQFSFAFRQPLSHSRFGPPPPTTQTNLPVPNQIPFPHERARATHPSSRLSLPPLSPPQMSQHQPTILGPEEPGPAGVSEPSGYSSFLLTVGTVPPSVAEPAGDQPSPLGTATGPGPRPESSAVPADPEPTVLPAPQIPVTTSVPPNTERRRPASIRIRRAVSRPESHDSDPDSEDDIDLHDILDDQHAMRIIEQFAGVAPVSNRSGDTEEARVRAHQLFRGQLSSKRVASKSALSSLQSVEIASLSDSERMCVICYNEFGVPNPEGINEAPLRLPKCKHVFGDHCIKKWFEESDSCPYCRDKLPSEPQFRANYEVIREFLRSSYAYAPRYARTAGENRVPGPTTTMSRDAYFRYMPLPHETRYDSSPPRTWGTGERRSSPSDGAESRRRTRSRHGSAWTMSAGGPSNVRPSSFSGAITSVSQQSPIRERPPLPPAIHRPYGGNTGRQIPMPVHIEPHVLGPPTIPNAPYPAFMPPPLTTPGLNDQPFSGLSHPEPPPVEATGNIRGAPTMAPYFSEPNAVNSTDSISYPTTSNGNGNYPASNRNLW